MVKKLFPGVSDIEQIPAEFKALGSGPAWRKRIGGEDEGWNLMTKEDWKEVALKKILQHIHDLKAPTFRGLTKEEAKKNIVEFFANHPYNFTEMSIKELKKFVGDEFGSEELAKCVTKEDLIQKAREVLVMRGLGEGEVWTEAVKARMKGKGEEDLVFRFY